MAELKTIVERFRPDVVHAHNLPDELTVAALDAVAESIPVVHDVHDLQSLRRTPYEDGFPEPDDPLALERTAIERSSAVVTVSDELLAEIATRYEAPQRTLVFPNFVLGRDLLDRLPERDVAGHVRNGLVSVVYQGTLAVNGGHYDLRELFASVVRARVSLDMHAARDVPEYELLAREVPRLRYHSPVPPSELLRVLPRYDLGWAGFNDALNAPHLDTALPNKLFEYLGCGLPVITLDHRALKRFVESERVGIALQTVEELDGRLAETDLGALRRRVASVRRRFTVEANIDRLLAFYATL